MQPSTSQSSAPKSAPTSVSRESETEDRPARVTGLSAKGRQATGAAIQEAEARPLDQNSFSTLGAITLAVCVINTWIAMLVALDAGLRAGGSISLVWGLLYTILCTYCTVLSHGELFAVLPTAAGQYAWAFLVSPPNYRAGVSWLTGMANIVGIWLDGTGAAFLCTRMLVAIIHLNAPSLPINPAKTYGLYAGLVILSPMSTLLLGSRPSRIIEWVMLRLAIISALAIVVTLLTMTKPEASAAFVFGNATLAPGYSNLVISFLIGILPSQYSFCGFDIVYHLSEEIKDPKRNGPTAAKWVILVAGGIAWFVLVCVLSCVPDLGVIESDDYGFAFARIVLASTGSRAAATAFVLSVLVIFTNSIRGMAMNAGRILLAFGRDGMIPFPQYWLYIRSGEPVFGILFTICVHLILGLVQLAPAAAFISLLGSSVIFTFTAYFVVYVSGFAAILMVIYFGFARRTYKGPKVLLAHPLVVGGAKERATSAE